MRLSPWPRSSDGQSSGFLKGCFTYHLLRIQSLASERRAVMRNKISHSAIIVRRIVRCDSGQPSIARFPPIDR